MCGLRRRCLTPRALPHLAVVSASLQQLIELGPGYPHTGFRTGELYDISKGVLDGLAAIHAFGYRHCDIKVGKRLVFQNAEEITNVHSTTGVSLRTCY